MKKSDCNTSRKEVTNLDFQANGTRYTDMVYSCCRNSGFKLPAAAAIMAARKRRNAA
ncbi:MULTISPECIES: hypothetical protein [Bacillus]|uniref:hypothetical protein n=1 Tax=Bacillus TaxID=1386 RepID=UPI0015840DFE|nr:hypothetical protein [Bacillus glycinifermentans]MBU8787253.1 hypothetical protein [Bacillus glycinifermentans]